ncbi:hypothetical protein Scep_029619 [Stephania cephalantha]|uniref:Uncharacterized protein n=1 Tax=Stephania cephalantha TaxID=152367 RepID=A0AAP0E1C5_9MAGN
MKPTNPKKGTFARRFAEAEQALLASSSPDYPLSLPNSKRRTMLRPLIYNGKVNLLSI